MSAILRRRYARLLVAYPPQWRAANAEVILDTLLEAASNGQQWPSPREAVALLLGGIRARVQQALAGDPARRWVDGLHLGAILLAVPALSRPIWLLLTEGSWTYDLTGEPAGGPLALSIGAWGLQLVVAMLLLRAQVTPALAAAAISVPTVIAADLAQLALRDGISILGLITGPNGLVPILWPLLRALPLLAVLAVLAVLANTRAPRPRSWGWLLLPVAFGIADAFVPLPALLLPAVLPPC